MGDDRVRKPSQETRRQNQETHGRIQRAGMSLIRCAIQVGNILGRRDAKVETMIQRRRNLWVTWAGNKRKSGGFAFSPDSDSYGGFTSNNNELAVRAFETGCRCRVLVLDVVLALAGCCELAVCVVETCQRRVLVLAVVLALGASCWLCAWWRQALGAGAVSWLAAAGCWCHRLQLKNSSYNTENSS